MKQLLSVLLLVVLFTGFINAQGKMALGFESGASIPSGKFKDASDMGYKFAGKFYFSVLPQLDATFNLGYLVYDRKVLLPVGSTHNLEGNFNAVTVSVGGQYYFLPVGIQPYGVLEIGMNFNSGELKGSVTSPDPNNPGQTITRQVDQKDETESKFAVGVGAGALFPVGKSISIDANVKYNIVENADNISIVAGIKFAL